MLYPEEFSLERVIRGVVWGLPPTFLISIGITTAPLVPVPKPTISKVSAIAGAASDLAPASTGLPDQPQAPAPP